MMSLNPQITTVKVGVKSIREVTVYPLSVADQFKLTDIISEVMQKVADKDFAKKDDMLVVDFIIKAIRRNVTKIFSFILDDKEKIDLGELTNLQLTEIINIIFYVNYEGMIKNLKDLSQKAKILWTSEGSSPKSVEKPVTD